MTKRGYLKRRELARRAAKQLGTPASVPWQPWAQQRQAAKTANFGNNFGNVTQRVHAADFSALELRVLEAMRVPGDLLASAAPGLAAQIEAQAEATKTTFDAVAEDLAVKAREELLQEPPPEVEAAQRLAGTYLTREEKKARLFGQLYGRVTASSPNFANLPRSKGTP